MSIPPRFLDEIRSRLNLSDIIGRRVRVTRAGREFKACCPFHNEKSPSFTINDDKQFYHCFGCGAHGDVIGFVMRHDNLAFMDAIEVLAAESGLQMPKPDPMAVEQSRKEKTLHDVLEAGARWFEAQLEQSSNADVLNYMEGRGLNAEMRQRFRLGFAPADGQALVAALKAEGFSTEQMIEVGLVKPSSKGGAPYAFFRDRVMFPVADKRGRIIAFGGRILPDHMRPPSNDGFKPPKYINTSDTPLFDKGRMLYGEAYARPAAREGHTLIVTEGYMDVIASHREGFRGAVAPMGTALTEGQIASLWAIAGEDGKMPVLCFDGDNAGRRAAERACGNILPLLKPGKSVRIAFLPDGQDPDSILRSEGKRAFQAVLAASLSLLDFLWARHTAGRAFETPEERAGLKQALIKDIATITDGDVQKHYKELVAERIDQAFFKRRGGFGFGAVRKGNGGVNTMPSLLKPRAPTASASQLSEKILLAAVINNPVLYSFVEEEFGRFPVRAPRLEALRQKVINVLEAQGEDEPLDTAAVRQELARQGYAQECDDILNESVYLHAAFSRQDAVKPYEARMAAGLWHNVREEISRKIEALENRQSWKAAFETANEGEEERLRGRYGLAAHDE